MDPAQQYHMINDPALSERTQFVAIWSEQAQEYRWYDKPEESKDGQPIEGSDGMVSNVYVATSETLTREDGQSATVYVMVLPTSYIRSSKYFAFEPAPDFGSVKPDPKPACPKYMKSRKKLLASIRRGY